MSSMLFIARKTREANQQIAISNILNNMRSRYTESKDSGEALVVMEFKMKLAWGYGAVLHLEEAEKGEIASVIDNKVEFNLNSDGDNKQDRGTSDEEGEDANANAWLAKERCEEQEDDDGTKADDDADYEMQEIATKNLDPQASTGPVTGIHITKQSQIRRRQIRWSHVLFLGSRLPLLNHGTLYIVLLEELYSSLPLETVVTDEKDGIQRNQRGL
ncbi:uncharacterized protein PHALS_06601 [Plasmopara halstedii]|uniref:Uncharacterized protein n=1 Tax=Plasmopara halstedii TaxID=4781 RepID=A0A0P1B239_PLAHL|nr:uncharacterized protein PHALS_06601 [Plasmopara halstedii]CEG48801.1 hypothetical protein PHALS_06601 [Plasmopara halstedii]|eukprot:XP_024585170.1 hypothetical protein PHALS_06601 [Plasmopara halstedii]